MTFRFAHNNENIHLFYMNNRLKNLACGDDMIGSYCERVGSVICHLILTIPMHIHETVAKL